MTSLDGGDLMARARLISRTLGTSRCYAELGKHAGDLGEFAQALYPQLVVYADDHGRGHGDAFTIKHAVWPTSPRSEGDFESALEAMMVVRLISRYEVEGVKFFQIRDFEQHQTGLHKRRPSRFPEVPGNSRKVPDVPGRPGKSGKFLGRNDTETEERKISTRRVATSRTDTT